MLSEIIDCLGKKHEGKTKVFSQDMLGEETKWDNASDNRRKDTKGIIVAVSASGANALVMYPDGAYGWKLPLPEVQAKHLANYPIFLDLTTHEGYKPDLTGFYHVSEVEFAD